MPEAIRGASLPHMASEIAAARRRQKAAGRKRQIITDVGNKTWMQLTPPEKDAIMEALALAAGLVKPAEVVPGAFGSNTMPMGG